MRAEQLPAHTPVEAGVVTRDGVRLAYEVHGTGTPTVLLLPTWSIVPSRYWKAQIGFLARHYRVVTFDGRGSGASDSPAGAEAYLDVEYAADAEAVMDATGTRDAVVVGMSCGVSWGLHLAVRCPDRVLGLFAIAPSCGLDVPQPARDVHPWDTPVQDPQGWGRYNRQHWLDDGLDEFREFFFEQLFSEPHSTKQIEDAMGWSAGLSPQTLADTVDGRLGLVPGTACTSVVALCAEVRCPVEVLHGTDDRVRGQAVGARLAELTGGSLTLIEGAGHGLSGREPVRTNQLLREFVDRVCPPPPRTRTWVRAASRPRRVLYLSSPIGLGHVRRDLAVADELRKLRPDLQVDWLAQEPVTSVLASAGERVHPASSSLANESTQIESEAGEHDLHAFQAVRRLDETLIHNFLVFDDLVGEEAYDLVVGDEAWEVDHFLHENPERKRFSFAWLTDFVGWLPMPSGGEAEAALTADHNAEMLEQRARYPRIRDRSLFVGDPDDVVTDPFGPGLPGIREWTESHFEFPGYIAAAPPDRAATRALRRRLGYRPDERVCVVTVGGSGVGSALLRRVLDAVPLARRERPDLRFLVVAGPRIDPSRLPRTEGAEVVGYVPDLVEHLACCDVAVVQGGLTTCMELTVAGTPFVYVPLQNHFEQNLHVRHRLERYGAGRHLDYADACEPALLAAAVLEQLENGASANPVAPGGAARTAALLDELL